MDKAKGGQDRGWEVGMGLMEGSGEGKWRQLHWNGNKKMPLKKKQVQEYNVYIRKQLSFLEIKEIQIYPIKYSNILKI